MKQTHWGFEDERDLPSQETRGRAIFVDKNPALCSDSYSGQDWGAPVCTFARGMALATDGAGDYIYMKPGVYFGADITKSNIHIIGEDPDLVNLVGPINIVGSPYCSVHDIEISMMKIGNLWPCGQRIHLHHSVIWDFSPDSPLWLDCTVGNMIHDNRIMGNVEIGFLGAGCPDSSPSYPYWSELYDNDIEGIVNIRANFIRFSDNRVSGSINVLSCASVVVIGNSIGNLGGGITDACGAVWVDNHWSNWQLGYTFTPPYPSQSTGWIKIANDLRSPSSGRLSIDAVADPALLSDRDLWLRVDHGSYSVRLAPDACYCLTNDPFPTVLFPASGPFDIYLKLDYSTPPGANIPVVLHLVEA